ncbi:uncharacterized protein METZ01_LOCUS466185, partial [marine metagenome]
VGDFFSSEGCFIDDVSLLAEKAIKSSPHEFSVGTMPCFSAPLIRQFKILFALLLAISLQAKVASEDSVTVQTPTSDYDVVVIGGTPAGIAAAIAAGRAGKTVLLIEQSPVLGGVLSSGVIRLDDLYVESNSG